MLLNIFLPLFNFLLLSILGRSLGKLGAMYLTTYNLLLTIFFNYTLLYNILVLNTTYFVYLGSWLNLGLLHVKWEFLLDFLAIMMLGLISLISFIVHVYSFAYMHNDPHFIRFISYISLFTFFMFILVTGSNFVQLFLGWEGVGICSYLLINFWFTRIQANKAAIKALIMNRLGDIGLIFAVVIVFSIFKTLDFNILYTLVPVYFDSFPVFFYTDNLVLNVFDIACFCLMVAVVGKSAQIGLHTWLPSAMEGPTPVSALIHAATMVTAGVFLLIRVSFLFECSPAVQTFLLVIALFTALLSAVTAIFLYDIKRIIAYSTCSQLGYMVVACTLSQYHIAFFHLLNHAFFKALLFLTAGAIIHSFNNEQDVRKLGNIFFQMPFIVTCVLVGNIAIMGLPFLAGFYSKDLIIEVTYLNSLSTFTALKFNFIYCVLLLATFCTGIYSLRLYYFLFLRQNTKRRVNNINYLKQPLFISISLVILLLGSIFVGYLLSDLFSINNKNLKYISHNFLFFVLNELYFENEYIPYYIKLAPFICNVLGFVFCLLFIYHYIFRNSFQLILLLLYDITKKQSFLQHNAVIYYCLLKGKVLVKICQNNFYFNEFYNYIALFNFHYYYTHMFLNLDKGLLELIGPTGATRVYIFLIKILQYFYKQTLTQHFFLIYNTILFYFFLVEYFM